jgi:hypothetical protein
VRQIKNKDRRGFFGVVDPIIESFSLDDEETTGKASFQLFGETLDEPIAYLTKEITFGTVEDIVCSRIHGDLNIDNILITKDEKDNFNCWLIDFDKSQVNGHTAFDFAKLEVEMRTQILSEYLHSEIWDQMGRGVKPEDAYAHGIKSYVACERRLYYPSSKSETPLSDISEFLRSLRNDTEIGSSRILNLLGSIMAVRHLAAGEVGIRYAEYLYGVFFYSLAALKFPNLIDEGACNSAPLPRLIAYLCASVTCGKIKKLVGK